MNVHLQSGKLQGSEKPPKVALAEESSHRKGTKQWGKAKGATEDDAPVKDKGKGKAVNAKALKSQKQSKHSVFSCYLSLLLTFQDRVYVLKRNK